jgi:signal transduction histidine kinase
MVAAVLTLVMAGGLALRRRFPLTAFAAGTAALCVESLLHLASPISPYASLILVYSLGLYGTRRRARWGPPAVVAGVLIYFEATAGTATTVPLDGVGVLITWLAAWAIGYSTARRREEQQRARRAIRQQVVAEEQTRMARELHDVVGHTVNLLVVQAGAARLTLDTDPATTRDLLTSMERTGRDALGDLDQILGTLRSAEASPGLVRLPDLVRRLTDSGVDVTLNVDAALRLPRNLDLSAYRIVQEALTNTLKHAAPCSATVDVHRAGREVVIDVSDDGRAHTATRGSGRGLIGIAERVSLCGGVLTHGAGEHGGFTLRAVLPLP